MWTADILKKDIDVINQQLILLVRFTTTDRAFDKKFSFSPDVTETEWKRRIKSEIERLEKADTVTVVTGTVDLTGINTGDTRTQDQKDRDLWLERNELRKRVERDGIAMGYIADTAPKYVALKNWLTTNFKPEYIDLV